MKLTCQISTLTTSRRGFWSLRLTQLENRGGKDGDVWDVGLECPDASFTKPFPEFHGKPLSWMTAQLAILVADQVGKHLKRDLSAEFRHPQGSARTRSSRTARHSRDEWTRSRAATLTSRSLQMEFKSSCRTISMSTSAGSLSRAPSPVSGASSNGSSIFASVMKVSQSRRLLKKVASLLIFPAS